MSLVGVFTVPGAQFPLTQVLGAVPNARVEIDRVAGDSHESDESDESSPAEAVFVFWAEADSPDALDDFETYLRHEARTLDLTCLDSVDNQRLYRLRWRVGDDDLVAPLVELPGEFLSGVGTADACRLVVRFPEEAAYEEFVEWCERHNVPIEEARRYTSESIQDLEAEGRADFLSALFEVGVLDENATLEDLATALGVPAESLPAGLDALYQEVAAELSK
ncbi:bacterio-opsin activator domain-containing protein [Halospeciosus flavus]|uniref:Bacterio-opsin activator domain-containing protein n=1 Tax=Halospeciosus flavus TaxID=3032283 RepID=A0ABD5Z5R0_9EURY|nr:bacterio-opsin activator domain-containing protein [Halospeciosus flavus]